MQLFENLEFKYYIPKLLLFVLIITSGYVIRESIPKSKGDTSVTDLFTFTISAQVSALLAS